MKIKNTLCAIVTALAFALPLKATNFEIGAIYNQGKTSQLASVSQGYKEGKASFVWKAEKTKGSPLALQAIGVYPLGKGYSANVSEKISVDPSFEPVQYLTSAGMGKTIGKGDISMSEAVSIKTGSDAKSYMTVLGASYKLNNKAKLCGTAIVPHATPNKPMFKGTVVYSL